MYISNNEYLLNFHFENPNIDLREDLKKIKNDKRLVNSIREKLKKTTFVFLKEDELTQKYLNDYFGTPQRNMVSDASVKKVMDSYGYKYEILTEEELLKKIHLKEFRYSEQKEKDKFLFYYDCLKELRSVSVGVTNFLVVTSFRKLKDYEIGDEFDEELYFLTKD
jgi:hypothetical protein